jgi:hypothetical protein
LSFICSTDLGTSTSPTTPIPTVGCPWTFCTYGTERFCTLKRLLGSLYFPVCICETLPKLC